VPAVATVCSISIDRPAFSIRTGHDEASPAFDLAIVDRLDRTRRYERVRRG